MTNGEKIFKIEKIRKYEKEISNEDKKIVRITFSTGLSALVAALSFSISLNEKMQVIPIFAYTEFLFGLINSACVITQLKDLLKSINKKTLLNIRIETINDELEFDKYEEIRGLKKW